MKAKYIIMLIVCAVVTLSFTLTSKSRLTEKAKINEARPSSSLAGGLASEDPIK